MEKVIKTNFSFEMPRLMMRRIEILARRDGVSKGEFIRRILQAEIPKAEATLRELVERDQLSGDPLESL